MMRISTISSLLLIGTTLGYLMKGWLTPSEFQYQLSDEDTPLYL